jgi:hypothetical protein
MHNLQWLQEDGKQLLKNNGTVLVTLDIKNSSNAVFMLNNRQYTVVQKGAWIPFTCVSFQGEEILRLSFSFWGSKGKILFNDGTQYNCRYSSKPSLKMQFADREDEILRYGIEFQNKRPVLTFTVGTTLLDADKLLILAALGRVHFAGIYNEIAGGDDITSLAVLSSVLVGI